MRVAKAVLGKAIIILITVCVLGLGSVNAQNVEYVGSTLWNECLVTEVQGNYAYCGLNNGLIVLDVSNPNTPILAGQLPIENYYSWEYFAADLSVSGDYVYLSGPYHALWIVDVSDPSQPALVSEFDLPGNSNKIYAHDDHVYLAYEVSYNEGELFIIDVSDPTNPVVEGSLYGFHSIYDIFVSGDLAYIADSNNGLMIIDISDHSNPQISATLDIGIGICRLYVTGNYVYTIGCPSDRLSIIDVSDPAAPELISNLYHSLHSTGISVVGSYAYISARYGKLATINITDPHNPFITGISEEDPAVTVLDKHLFVSENYAYISDAYGGLQILDISDPYQPEFASKYSPSRKVQQVTLYGNYAVVADALRGINIVDISNPSDPTPVSFIEPEHYGIARFSIFNDYLYTFEALQDHSSFRIMDISDVYNPILLGTLDMEHTSARVFVSSSYAYLIKWPTGLEVIDVSNLENPLNVGSCETPNNGFDLFVSGNYAYIPAGYEGLQIIDVSDPNEPAYIQTFQEIKGFPIYISGEYMYLAGGTISIFDISNPLNPISIGSCYLNYRAEDIYVSNGLAYVAESYGGLEIINVSDPGNPRPIAYFDTPGEAGFVEVDGDNIYIGDLRSFIVLQHTGSGCGIYTMGDYNGSRVFNIADIISAFSKLKTGSPEASLLCECPPGSGDVWPVAMDLNNSCSFNVADVIAGFSKLKTGEPELIPCEACPPGGR
ncbi:MAG: hypothetical protein V3W18_04395 [candidate division Zixibacteria bacterium]